MYLEGLVAWEEQQLPLPKPKNDFKKILDERKK